jgi:SAM-dependent methyltransferase
MSDYYWLAHRRFVEHGRMRWHAEPADESFWFDHWQDQVNLAYFRRAENINLQKDEFGKILLAEIQTHGTHLEAGCGAGFWVAALRQAGLNVVGIEYARDLVELVNHVYPQLPIRFGDALAIDYPDNSFVSYLSFGVVEHRLEGPEIFLREAFRVLTPGGKLIITVPHMGPLRRTMAKLGRYDNVPPAEPFFQYGFTANEFSAFIRNAGFVIDYSRPLHLHRLLQEELGIYRWLSQQRGSTLWRDLFRRLFHKLDGHLLLCVARKPVHSSIPSADK